MKIIRLKVTQKFYVRLQTFKGLGFNLVKSIILLVYLPACLTASEIEPRLESRVLPSLAIESSCEKSFNNSTEDKFCTKLYCKIYIVSIHYIMDTLFI